MTKHSALGYIIVPDALAPADHAAVSQAMDVLHDRRHGEGLAAGRSLEDPLFTTAHDMCDEAAVVRMVSNAKVRAEPLRRAARKVSAAPPHCMTHPKSQASQQK